MRALRHLVLVGLVAAGADACGGSSPGGPSSVSGASASACQLTNGKVQVVIGYARDPAKVTTGTPSIYTPVLVLVDFGDLAPPPTAPPQMTRIDDYTWTSKVLVAPNPDP